MSIAGSRCQMTVQEDHDKGGSVFEVIVTADHIRAAEPAMAGAWISQNRRFEEAMERAVPLFSHRNIFVALRVLAPMALLMSLLWVALEIACTGSLKASGPLLFLGAALGALTWLLWRFSHEQATRWRRGLADRLILRAVRKTVQRAMRLAPFQVAYRVGENEVRVEARELGIRRRFHPGNTALVIRAGSLYLFFRRRIAQRWAGVVYVGSSEQDRAFQDFLARHGIELSSEPALHPASPD